MSANTLGADINEIQLAFLLNGNSFPSNEAERTYNNRVSTLTAQGKTSEIADQNGRAQVTYDRFLKFLSDNKLGNPVEAYWTARPGIITRIVGFNVDQSKNPTDVLVKLSTGKFYGISLKSTKAGKTGFKNPGMGTVETALGLGISKPFTKIVDKYRKMVVNHLGSAVKDTDVARKTYFKSNPNVYKIIQTAYVIPCYEELRESLYNHLSNNMEPWEQQVFLGADIMNEDEETMKLPYIKITGSGTNGNYTTDFYDPIADSKMNKIITKGATFSKKVSPSKNTVQVKSANQDLFQIRWKWADKAFASSMKLSAE
jgi:hypothetical protein